MTCLVDAGEVMGQSQEGARALHSLLLVFGGDPIIRHIWFIAHWPEPLAERTSVMVASSKYSQNLAKSPGQCLQQSGKSVKGSDCQRKPKK